MAVQLWMRASCNHLPPALMSFLIITLKVNWRQWRSIIGIRYLYSLDKAKDFSTKCFLLTLKHALLNVVTAFLIRCKNFCVLGKIRCTCVIFFMHQPHLIAIPRGTFQNVTLPTSSAIWFLQDFFTSVISHWMPSAYQNHLSFFSLYCVLLM